MGLFGPRKVRCPAGVWTKLISNFGRGYARNFSVDFVTDDGREATGMFIEKRYFWIFPQEPIEGSIAPSMTFQRQWINGIYSVRVRLDADGWATVR